MGAIFLSASVPTRQPYASDSRPQEIQAAVIALAQVVLGRRKLVWGGQPDITPLLWVAAQSVGVEYTKAVELFQSRFFDGKFPKENDNFSKITKVDAVDNDREKSLLAMREAMLSSEDFEAAVFIGGMDGVDAEYDLFVAKWPNAKCVPLAHTGGAAALLVKRMSYQPPANLSPFDFVALLYKELGIRPSEKRVTI